MCCAVAESTEIVRERTWFRADSMGQLLRERLNEEFSDHPNVDDVRGLGLLQGIGLVANRETGEPFPRSVLTVIEQLHCSGKGCLDLPERLRHFRRHSYVWTVHGGRRSH